jgi:putative membrane protein
MMNLLIRWLLMSLSLLLVSYIVPGFYLTSFGTALVAAVVFGLLNATLGLLLKIMTFPFTVLTLGLFWFVINAIILELTSAIVRGFFIRSFLAAFVGAVVLTLLNMLLRLVVSEVETR